MLKNLIIIGALLSFSGTQSFGQSFSPVEWDAISLNILNTVAENRLLKKNAASDSVVIHSLMTAYMQKERAQIEMQKALELQERINIDNITIMTINETNFRKDIRKQKRLKWLGFGIAVVLGGVAILK